MTPELSKLSVRPAVVAVDKVPADEAVTVLKFEKV